MAGSYIVAFFGGMPGGPELLIVLVAMLLLFGSKNLPKMARTLGKTIEEFRRATREVSNEIMRADEALEETPPPALPPEVVAKAAPGQEPPEDTPEEAPGGPGPEPRS